MKLPVLIEVSLSVWKPRSVVDRAQIHPQLSTPRGRQPHVRNGPQPKCIYLHKFGQNPQRQQGLRLLLDLSPWSVI